MERQVLRRGEIWTAAGGQPYTGKPRPVLVIQDDRFDANDSITICPLTSDATNADLFRIALDPAADNGLRRPSCVMVDKITTVPRTRIGRRLGSVGADEMSDVERAIVVFLGLAGGQRAL